VKNYTNNIKEKHNMKKSLGPVKNLEEHLDSDWWKNIFNSLYLKTDGDVVNDDNITTSEIDLILNILELGKEDRILDLSCGHGRHSLELARRGFCNIEGFDRSRYLIQKAKQQAKKENLCVKFKEGEARNLTYKPDTFDAILVLGNSFGYFETVQDDLKVLNEIISCLKPWGKLLIDIADGNFLLEHFQPRSWEWIDKNHFVCRERSISSDGNRLISREVISHITKGVLADQFYAERLYTFETLSQILEKAGFTNIQIHGNIITESQKNQDLGMMEKRLVISAVARKEWTPVKKKKTDLKNIVVLLGDPSKNDPLKPQSIFDDDDFYTIDQLKDALRQIKGYNFTYLNNHDTMINDLIKLRPKTDFIFNLCDEGYYNNATMELHVPSILEILNINYTGSSPQCLAYCYDKSLIRGIAQEMSIPVPEAIFINPEDSVFDILLNFPVITKPNFGDSSFGITKRSVAHDVETLANAISEIRDKFGYEKPILIEEFLYGKDLSVGIIGNPPDSYSVLPIIEEDYSKLPEDLPKICGYEAKWMPDSPYWQISSIPANLEPEIEKFIVECCLKLYDRLEIRDYCRFDWRMDSNGNPKLLEVNPNPGWCWDGHLAKMAKLDDISYLEMLAKIIKAAEMRIETKK
jgi:D-alanine-D-alanine ligase